MEVYDCLTKEQLFCAKDAAINVCKQAASILAAHYSPLVTVNSQVSDSVSSNAPRVQYTTKQGNTSDLVTALDKHIEEIIRNYFSEKFPSYAFLGEETAGTLASKDARFCWVVDPIDGTTNFVHQFPNSCISIGLVQIGSGDTPPVPLVGVICHPVHSLVYWAVFGHGAFMESFHDAKQPVILPIKLDTSNQTLQQVLVSTEFGSQEWRFPKEIQGFLSRQRDRVCHYPTHGIRCIGSAALNLVHLALGQIDLYYQYGIHAWDLAAGVLIVKEAGGYVGHIHPRDLSFDIRARNILAATDESLAIALRDRALLSSEQDLYEHDTFISTALKQDKLP